MKYTIGMLELSPFEVLGDPLFPQRYCSQVIIPLISMLEADERLRVTLVATGAVVEYLAERLPLVLKKIRTLIEQGRTELLCSAYTNADWQIFPSSDLRRSRRITNEILNTHGLPLSRTMFAQHNTYWPAMASLQDEFDVFLIRDSFLKGRNAVRQFSPMARVGKSLLVVASNNLMHDMAARLVSQKVTDVNGLFTEGRLENAVEGWSHSDPRFVDITIGDDSWHWFHSAGAHHFTTGVGLRNWEFFFSDFDWMQAVQDFFEEMLSEGITFRLVSEFTDAAGALHKTLPDLADASWGLDGGNERAYWLGGSDQRMRAVMSWTTLSWRSRMALRRAEDLVDRTVQEESSEALDGKIEALWRRQLWTEVSPSANRGVAPCEVDFIREHSEAVMRIASELCLELGPRGFLQKTGRGWDNGLRPLEPSASVPETEIINGEGTVKWFFLGNGIYRFEARFVSEESTCGIGFKLSCNGIEFTNCGDEDEVANAPLSLFDGGGGTLTSPTGLYGLGEGIYLIRHNHVVSVGAQLGPQKTHLCFLVDFAPEGRNFEWSFTVVQGNALEAIAVAKRINAI